MEENREPLSAIAIEKKLQLLRNKHFSEDTIALVKSDYEYGLTEEEISLYLNKSYDIEQMKILSECLHKDVPKDVIDIIKNTKYSVHQMQVSLEFYEKGVPVQTIKEVMDKGEKPITMRRLYEEVLEQLNKVKEQIPEESEYVKALISQMDEVVEKINHQNERYDALNNKLSEIETSKDDEEVRERLVKENQDKDALINSQQNELNKATEKLANVREDVKARDKELIDNPEFSITIGKAAYTERVDGGTMMLEAISKCKTGETTAIGKFHGFELLVEKNFLGINYMVLRGKTEYKAELSTSPVGSMVKLENLFNGLHENIDFLEKKIEQYQNDLEASKSEYDKPFAYSTELEEKLARQCELNAQLDLENAKAVDADLSGPGKEREADDRMESAAIVAEDKGAYQADREGRTR